MPQVVYNAACSISYRRFSCRVYSGGLAQLGEHNVRNVGVGGSNPLPSTIQHDPFLRFEIHGLALVA